MNIYLFQRIIGIGVLALQIVIVLLIGYSIYKKTTKKTIPWVENIFFNNGMLLVAITSLLAIVGSLIFSEVYKVPACKLCWYQRAVMYPQLITIGIGIWKKWNKAWLYSLWLSIIGFIIAGYQTTEQFRIKTLPEVDCVIGPDAACSQIHMLEFGYITFPLASLSLFAFVIVLYLIRKKKTN